MKDRTICACAAASAEVGPWYNHSTLPKSAAACLAPVSIASKYGEPCSFGTNATLILPPASADELALPDVDGGASSFFVQPPVIIAMANATLTAPTTRWEIGIDSSFGLG